MGYTHIENLKVFKVSGLLWQKSLDAYCHRIPIEKP